MFYRYRHTAGMPDSCIMGQEFEQNEPMSAPALRYCPDCASPVERIIEGGQRPITNYTPTHHSPSRGSL